MPRNFLLPRLFGLYKCQVRHKLPQSIIRGRLSFLGLLPLVNIYVTGMLRSGPFAR